MLERMWSSRNSFIAGENAKWNHLGNILVASYKTEQTHTGWSSNCAPQYSPKGVENLCLHTTLHVDIIAALFAIVTTQEQTRSVLQSEVSQKEKNKYRVLTHIYGIQKNGTDEAICRAGIEMQSQRKNLWTQWGKERVGRIERVALAYIHYHG